MSHELPRWGDDAPAQVRAAKAAYGELAPDEATLERLLAGVEAEAAKPASTTGSSGLRLVPRLAFAGLGAALIAALIWAFARSGAPAAPPRTTSPAPPTSHVTATQAEPPLPATEVTTSETDAGTEPGPPITRRVTSRPRTQRAHADTSGDALSELALLARARRVLRADAERSLELCEEHARDYPSGVLQEERELLAIEALATLDRAAPLARRAAAFQRRFPASVHLPRVRELARK